ncbi:MAG: 50S ribosomal protein L13 [Bacteroidales bacterium]|nr:50S ribosomal protein L13 [Bacteroidales bacterium]MCF8337975.1 50S ribosomal protein L13 [Bacteroidales bacterium]
MDTVSYKTLSANKNTVHKEWLLVDATNQPVGRLASNIAYLLRGKHKPDFTPHVDCGDNVVVINAEKVRLTGKKWTDKEYVRFTGYPGGKRVETPREVLRRFPERIVEKAVWGMLPKNRLGRAIFKNLKVYAGSEHKQEAQKPREIKINEIK